MRRTVVLGGGGFIGGHMVSALLSHGIDVRAVDIKPFDAWLQLHPNAENLVLDLSERANARIAVEGREEIFNLAADMGGIGYIENNRALCMLNILISTNTLMAAQQSADRYFFASSACVYRADLQAESFAASLSEEDAYPAQPEDGYGWEKLFSERMCRHFREDFGLETRVARLHNVYGPHCKLSGTREKAPAAICRKIATIALGGEAVIDAWGDGSQTRSFTYIDDAVQGIQTISRGAYAHPVNLGSDQAISIDGLINLIAKIAGVEVKIRYEPAMPHGVQGRNSDNRLIRSEYDWQPDTPLLVGMESLYKWTYDRLSRMKGR